MRSMVKAAIRIIVIMAALSLLSTVSQSVIGIVQQAEIVHSIDNFILYWIVEVVLIVVVGFLLLILIWAKADFIARKIVGRTRSSPLEINASNTDLVEAAMRVVGIVLIATSIPAFLGLVSFHFYYESLPVSAISEERLTGQEIERLVVFGARLIVGLWLFLGNQRIAQLFNKARQKLVIPEEPRAE